MHDRSWRFAGPPFQPIGNARSCGGGAPTPRDALARGVHRRRQSITIRTASGWVMDRTRRRWTRGRGPRCNTPSATLTRWAATTSTCPSPCKPRRPRRSIRRATSRTSCAGSASNPESCAPRCWSTSSARSTPNSSPPSTACATRPTPPTSPITSTPIACRTHDPSGITSHSIERTLVPLQRWRLVGHPVLDERGMLAIDGAPLGEVGGDCRTSPRLAVYDRIP
jgi:hypothetical protein